jgi:hypothetical protein
MFLIGWIHIGPGIIPTPHKCLMPCRTNFGVILDPEVGGRTDKMQMLVGSHDVMVQTRSFPVYVGQVCIWTRHTCPSGKKMLSWVGRSGLSGVMSDKKCPNFENFVRTKKGIYRDYLGSFSNLYHVRKRLRGGVYHLQRPSWYRRFFICSFLSLKLSEMKSFSDW